MNKNDIYKLKRLTGYDKECRLMSYGNKGKLCKEEGDLHNRDSKVQGGQTEFPGITGHEWPLFMGHSLPRYLHHYLVVQNINVRGLTICDQK